ncbi:MAG TPA: phosphocholine cytidylyltransferase family protein, partial [Methanosarcinaceae archaeon]|nr:phosphocholine cytidylyltransferase family protein [Methanosarcinaceae archaeon]HJH29136.1 phosphocholine cytidylyltransferase family protein [Methanosarcinaceae archaeon]
MNLNHSSNSDNGLVTTALLLAAGKGSRLYPLTH